jgi:hypothetical protein
MHWGNIGGKDFDHIISNAKYYDNQVLLARLLSLIWSDKTLTDPEEATRILEQLHQTPREQLAKLMKDLMPELAKTTKGILSRFGVT